MRFFVIKLTLRNGSLLHPWTMFDESYQDAMSRFLASTTDDDVVEIEMKERPLTDAAAFGRNGDDPDTAIMQHPDYVWTQP